MYNLSKNEINDKSIEETDITNEEILITLLKECKIDSDNFLKAIVSIIGRDEPPKNIGIENDHVTLDVKEKLTSIFTFSVFSDVSKDLMQLRMINSAEEIEIIKNGANFF